MLEFLSVVIRDSLGYEGEAEITMCLSHFYLDISFTLLSREKGLFRINLLVEYYMFILENA
jgi:hypothetical protein